MQAFPKLEEGGPNGSGEDGLHRGPWAEWEDELLAKYVAKYGEGNWASVKEKADIGLKRCGKSCRLRYLNHLKPGLKKGAFSEYEEDLIFTLHTYYGNKWSRIALELPGRTDNEIKNFYHYKCKKLENAKLPVPGQSEDDKALAQEFVHSRLSTEELSINLFPRELPPLSLLGKRERADTPEREPKYPKLESARSGVPPTGQQGNSNITLRIPIIGPDKPLDLGDACHGERLNLIPRLKRPGSSKSLESAGKLAQTAIDAARATVSAGGRADDAAMVAVAALNRGDALEAKPSDSVAHLMTGVARLAAEAVMPRASKAGFDLGGAPRHLPAGFLAQRQRLELLARLYRASEQQGVKVQQQVAALFPASPASILDVAQLDPQRRQLLEVQVLTMLGGGSGDLNRQASDAARLEILRRAAEADVRGAGGLARPLDGQIEQTLERAEAFLRPKQESGCGGVGPLEQSFDRRPEEQGGAQPGGWENEFVYEGGGLLRGIRGGAKEEEVDLGSERGLERNSPISHLEGVAQETDVLKRLRGNGGSIGSEDARTQDSQGSLFGAKMRAFKELRRPQLDILGQDPEPGPLTAAVGRHLSPSESTARTPGWLCSPRLSAGRKKWTGPIWKTVDGHSVDISEMNPDYVSELWGLDAETFACKTPTLSLFPGAISDDEAFTFERGPSTSRSPSSSDGPWLSWPYDGKLITRDEVSGQLVSPRTVMEAIESGPLYATPRSPRDLPSPSGGQLTSLSSKGSGGAPQWWLSLIGTPREHDKEREEAGGSETEDAEKAKGGSGEGSKELESGITEGERGAPLYREASLRIEGKIGEGQSGENDAWRKQQSPTEPFTFSSLLSPCDYGAGEGQKAQADVAAESGPESDMTGGSSQGGSMLEQVRNLFTRAGSGSRGNPD